MKVGFIKKAVFYNKKQVSAGFQPGRRSNKSKDIILSPAGTIDSIKNIIYIFIEY
jgi:hypothetical protein